MSSPLPLAHVAVLLQHTDNGKVLPADGQLLAQGVALEGLFLQISADDAYVLVAGSVDVRREIGPCPGSGRSWWPPLSLRKVSPTP